MPVAVKVEPREFPVQRERGRRRYPWDELSVGDWFHVDIYTAYKEKAPGKMLGILANMCREHHVNSERRFQPIAQPDSGVRIYRIK